MEQNDLDLNKIDGITEDNQSGSPQQPQSNIFSKPFIAGILLLIAGILAILQWVQFYIIDIDTISSLVDISQIQEIDPSITVETIVNTFKICSIIGIIISIFTILGGIISVKRKLWGIALTCSIIGLGSIGISGTSSLLSFIAMVLLIVSRKEY